MACKTFHKGKYYITFKRGFEDCKKDITITIDKVFESDSLKISLSDDDEPSFLCVLVVSRLDYEDLKKQQGLLIDFDNFPSQLVRLLQQCANNNMFLIMQMVNPVQYYFEIVEHNEFKRLVHLSLKTGPATDSEIKQHMAETIYNLKKSLSALKSAASSTETILNDKCINMERKIHDLSMALTKMEDEKERCESEFHELIRQEKDRFMQEKAQWQKNVDMTMKAQQSSFQEELKRRERQIDELNCHCKQLQENVSALQNQLSDKSQRLNVLETEVQKTHIEVATLKAKNASLEREIAEKDKQYNQLNSRYVLLDKTLKDNAETINDLTNSLHLARKEKLTLEEKLALSESLLSKNNEAAHATSEQLAKANQVISKQNADLIEMKDKLLCRTAIALEQEKVIERNTKEIEDLKSEVSDTKQCMEKLRTELQTLKEKCDINEKALKDRDETIKNNNMVIQWLHKKMENTCPPQSAVTNNKCDNAASSSTPYFLTRNNIKSTAGQSDDSIDFYATSKLTNSLDESPRQESAIRNCQAGLDPMYLQPAVESNRVGKKGKDSGKTVLPDSQKWKGKENINVELPKVDYREKKSSRGTTYRATPVSAYFP